MSYLGYMNPGQSWPPGGTTAVGPDGVYTGVPGAVYGVEVACPACQDCNCQTAGFPWGWLIVAALAGMVLTAARPRL